MLIRCPGPQTAQLCHTFRRWNEIGPYPNFEAPWHPNTRPPHRHSPPNLHKHNFRETLSPSAPARARRALGGWCRRLGGSFGSAFALFLSRFLCSFFSLRIISSIVLVLTQTIDRISKISSAHCVRLQVHKMSRWITYRGVSRRFVRFLLLSPFFS